ncbi:hypothetical protein FOL47_002407 [Perkinsus chesapeaki]|uniref:Sorl1p n=1 Tax=Perkinsus chesapeaki TaxID=330153 RepID=A0A7J6MF79_PERCH|nr:hypothetical protein FOL47_002407 [Perkinsus chesapeaki]
MLSSRTAILLASLAVLAYGTEVDSCKTLCSGVAECTDSHCMTYKVPAVCHGLLQRGDGSLCSAADDSTCSGSVVLCGNSVISSAVTTTTTTTTTSCTITTPLVSEEALQGTWCSRDLRRDGVTPIEVVSFAGDKLMFLYDGEVYYMQYFYEGNQVYVLSSDPVADAKLGKSLNSLRFSYFVKDMLAVWEGQIVGDLVRTGGELDCDPLPGAEVPYPIRTDLFNTRWCYKGENESILNLELRFNPQFMILHIPGKCATILLSRYEVNGYSYEIYLYDMDDGFKDLDTLGNGVFKLIYYGDWLFLVSSPNLTLRLDKC